MKTDGKMLKNARALRKNMTRQERHLWYDFLRFHPMKFYKQRPIGPYITDFYCHAAKLVLELDGGQHFEPEGQQADRIRDLYLKEQGLRVLRFPNSEVDQNFSGVCRAIEIALAQASPSGADTLASHTGSGILASPSGGGGTAKP